MSQQLVRRSIEPLLAWAHSRAADRDAKPDLRAACLRISLRNGTSPEQAIELAAAALELRSPSAVQRAAVQEISTFDPVTASQLLFGSWRSFGPAVRKEVLSAALSRPALSEELVARIEAGDISRAEIDMASRQRLLNANKDTIRRRAKLIFGDLAAGNRQAVIDKFKDLDLAGGDVGRGREVFLQKCASCHALDGQGHSVGPDLAALSDRSTTGLLTAILDPSRAIEPKYALYQALTHDGRVYSGVLAVENAAQIELIEQDNRRHVVPRAEIEELSSSDQSLMPEGLEKDLTRQQLADLIGYLQKTAGIPGVSK
jgi:putative heme-binding domain-containing protein